MSRRLPVWVLWCVGLMSLLGVSGAVLAGEKVFRCLVPGGNHAYLQPSQFKKFAATQCAGIQDAPGPPSKPYIPLVDSEAAVSTRSSQDAFPATHARPTPGGLPPVPPPLPSALPPPTNVTPAGLPPLP